MNAGREALTAAHHLADLGRWREAAEALRPALAAEDTAYEAHCLHAHCLLNARSALSPLWWSESRGAVRAALRLEPHGAWAHRLLALLLLDEGRKAAALREAVEAVRINPEDAGALNVLARCQLACFKVDEARRTAGAAIEANPQDPFAYLTLAEVARARYDWAEAERAYRDGLRLDPEHEALALGLGELLFMLHRTLESAEVYLGAARVSPENDALSKAFTEIWWHLRIIKDKWRRNPRSAAAPELADLAELIGPARSEPIDAAVRDLRAATSESRVKVEKLLERALDVFGSVAELMGATAYTSPGPGTELKSFAYPMPAVPGPPAESGWYVLGMDDDPVPGDVSRFRLAVATLGYEGELTAEYAAEFDAVAHGSAGLRVRDGDDADFHELMVEIHEETTRLALTYRAWADALSAFAAGVTLAKDQSSGARSWAASATRFRDHATTAEQAREWEDERQEAIRSAHAAAGLRNEAEARCVEALRAALPR
ncbi:tetratricopeptide repeat protein [Nonomuraea rhodomycinica]|uniref:Tetratricopeptide repeat protein n=1 Tax=Nonomuraea rhodomycinica TaxID=1712872 RepID=A0A7Y6INC6_9ACTN|nr:tetratricopeptide repeat protein [Nonomuraea rhodomycinica]NUW41352.1 tetratricopeptide repeat protein [Nonomuraea rhodomycinica]